MCAPKSVSHRSSPAAGHVDAAGPWTLHGLRFVGDLQRHRDSSSLPQLQPSQPLWRSDSATPSAL